MLHCRYKVMNPLKIIKIPNCLSRRYVLHHDSEGGPPDLEAWIRSWLKKSSKPSAPHESQNHFHLPRTSISPHYIGFMMIGLLFLWALLGIYVVSPVQQAVVLRFGSYVETVGPGPHWAPRFIDRVYKVDVQRIGTFSYRAEMLTQDENIASASLAVLFRVENPRKFLFNVINPLLSLQQATASALRQVVGHTTLEHLLTTGRLQVRDEVAKQINHILSLYHTGLLVTDVNLQSTKPPQEVTAAFDDAIKAREDKQRFINQAEAYAEKVVPLAQGVAKRLLRQAQAFREQVVLRAKTDIADYLALLPEYNRAPEVVRAHIRLKTAQSVLAHTHKVWIDVPEHSQQVFYIPLHRGFVGDTSSRGQKTLSDSHLSAQNDISSKKSFTEKLKMSSALSDYIRDNVNEESRS